MKLRNKKTGEIGDIAQTSNNAIIVYYPIVDGVAINPQHRAIYDSLAELNEEWEDYEEPKEWWFIDCTGFVKHGEGLFTEKSYIKDIQQIGNFFETKEEAEKAVRKLEALKRLMDNNLRLRRGCMAFVNTDEVFTTMDVNVKVDTYADIEADLDLLFGGEE